LGGFRMWSSSLSPPCLLLARGSPFSNGPTGAVT
jgi:hypothetical protein